MKHFPLFTLFMFTLGSCLVTPVMAQEELVYVPVEPCRVVDTRNGGGAITANTNRNFQVSGTMGELAVQGGKMDCLDPKAGSGQKPLAISAYVVAVPASGSTGGVLTAYPSHRLPPPVGAGSTVNFAAGQVIGNTTNITLCDQTPCPTDGEFAILARNTNQHVVIDVQGYFYPLAMKSDVIVDANDQIIGRTMGGESGRPLIMTSQGYVASVSVFNGQLSDRITILYTGVNCTGTAYMDLLNSLNNIVTSGGISLGQDETMIGTVMNIGSIWAAGSPIEYWYSQKTPTLVNNIPVQSVKAFKYPDTVLCDPVSATITTAVEMFPNDPAVTGIQNTAFPAPLRYDYR